MESEELKQKERNFMDQFITTPSGSASTSGVDFSQYPAEPKAMPKPKEELKDENTEEPLEQKKG
jgi:hypothetical protein